MTIFRDEFKTVARPQEVTEPLSGFAVFWIRPPG